MTERYDAIVVGVGGMGSAALYHLARRGQARARPRALRRPARARVVARGDPDHPARALRASVLRAARPARIRAVARARARGRRAAPPHDRCDRRRRRDVRRVTSLVPPSGTCRTRLLDGRELGRRFPAFRLPDDLPVLFQPDGGFLTPERSIASHARAAGVHGRRSCGSRERVLGWEELPDAMLVHAESGPIKADRLVLTAGAWSQEVARLCPRSRHARSRQALVWLRAAAPGALLRRTLSRVQPRHRRHEHLYGFPVYGVPGFKAGRYDREGRRGADPDGLRAHPSHATRRRFAPSSSATSRTAPGRPSTSGSARSRSRPTRTSSWTGTRRASASSSRPASPDAVSSSALWSARSWPTWHSTATLDTTSAASG